MNILEEIERITKNEYCEIRISSWFVKILYKGGAAREVRLEGEPIEKTILRCIMKFDDWCLENKIEI